MGRVLTARRVLWVTATVTMGLTAVLGLVGVITDRLVLVSLFGVATLIFAFLSGMQYAKLRADDREPAQDRGEPRRA